MREVPLSMISELKLKLSVMFGRGTVFTRSEQYTPWGVCDREGCSHDEDSTPREGGGSRDRDGCSHDQDSTLCDREGCSHDQDSTPLWGCVSVTEKGVRTTRTVHSPGEAGGL